MTIGTFFAAVAGIILLPQGDTLEKLRQYFFLPKQINPWITLTILIIFAAPMIIDGFAQIIFPYNSIELTRFSTGLVFGYFRGCILMVVLSVLLQIGVQCYER